MSTPVMGTLSSMAIIVMAAVVTLSPLNSSAAEFLQMPDGAKVDLSQKCPVCGMVVGGKDGQGVTVSFKDGHVVGFHGVAAAVFRDGKVVGFEGARCLFIYNSVPQKYDANVADIADQYVTDFVTKKMIALTKAFLVLGSDVKGPMGYDLVPFSSKQEAEKFASEHDGKWIVQLHEVARGAPKASGDTTSRGKTEVPGIAEEKAPTPAVEPSMVPPAERAREAPRTRSAPQRGQGVDPYDPSVGRSGHHGAGHMH